jgi:hypothetical protein
LEVSISRGHLSILGRDVACDQCWDVDGYPSLEGTPVSSVLQDVVGLKWNNLASYLKD